MFLKYIGQPSFTTAKGEVFNKDEVKEIDDKVGSTLLETFIGMFEDVTPKAPAKSTKVTKDAE